MAHFLVAVVITWWTVSMLGAAHPRLAGPHPGFLYDNRVVLEQMFPGTASHSGAIAVVSPVLAVLGSFGVNPLIIWVTTAMWLVPLLVWTVRPTTEVPHWVRKAMPDTVDPPLLSEQLPSLRKPLRVALLGGTLGAIAVAAAMAYQHTWQPPAGQRSGLWELVYTSLLFLALAVAPVVAAVTTALIALQYRLPLVLAGVAALVAFAAAFLLSAVDGCLGPLNTMGSGCQWQPTFWPFLAHILMLAVLGPGMFVAAAVALLVDAVWRLVERRRPGSLCTDINQTMRSANAYFPIPDPALQTDWSMTISQLTQASADCQHAVQQMDNHLFQTAIDELIDAMSVAVPLVGKIHSEAGLRDGYRATAYAD